MSSNAKEIILSRAGGRVERCHTYPHHGSYSNAMHSWGVAMLMHYIWPEDFQRLALYCLTHDIPEVVTGDIPSPVLRHNPNTRSELKVIERRFAEHLRVVSEHALVPEDYEKLKACDRLEFWLWSREQVALGNQFAVHGLMEIERFFEEHPLPPKAEYVRQMLAAESVTPELNGLARQFSYKRKELECPL